MSLNNRAKILVLAPNRPGDGLGGAERHLNDLLRVISPLCADVRVISLADAPPLGPLERLLTKIEPMLKSPIISRRLNEIGLPDADILISVELMGTGLHHPNHLHLFFGSYTAFRKSALHPEQGFYKAIRSAKAFLAKNLECRTQGRLGAIANSEGLRDALLECGVPATNTVIPPPTDCERFCPGDKALARKKLGLKNNQRIVLYAGRWEYAKGADRCAQLIHRMPMDWHMLIASPSAHSFPLPEQVNTTVMHDLSTEEMITVYQAADALVQPSRFEGYSLVVSEAQACGLPVFTSNVGQAAHLQAAKDALVGSSVVTNAQSTTEWIQRLNDLFRDDHRLKQASRSHRSYALNHVSYEVIQRRWQNYFTDTFKEYTWLPR